MSRHESIAGLVNESRPAEQEPVHGPEKPEPDKHPLPPKKFFFGFALLLVGLVGLGIYGHWRQDADAGQTQEETINFVPTVRTTTAVAEIRPVELVLPGQTRAFDTANIFARATGYIADRRVDIGSRVKKGDLLVA